MDSGLAYKGCQSISVDNNNVLLVTSVPNGFSCSNGTIALTNSGQTLDLSFGTVQNTDLVTFHTITIEYSAVVLNTAAVNRSGLLNNLISATFTVNGGSHTRNASAPNVTVQEPTVLVNKTVNPITGDANDTVNFTITITASSGTDFSHAYNVVFSDDIPAGYTYVPGSLLQSGTAPTSGPTLVGTTISATWDDLAPGASTTFTYSATLDSTVVPDQVITNTAGVTYTSLPGSTGSPISGYNTNACERTGDPTLMCSTSGTYPQNDYIHSDPATVTVVPAAMGKTITSTSATFTTGNDLTIGEEATFLLTVTLPEGETPTLVVTDLIPTGMAYVANSYSLDHSNLAQPGGATFPTPSISPDPTTNGTDGQDLVITFSNPIEVLDDNDPDNNSFTIGLRTVLLNVIGNQNIRYQIPEITRQACELEQVQSGYPR